MGAQIQFYKFTELADGGGEVSPESEVAYVDKGDTPVRVKLYARLVTPEVRVLVEVPVRPLRPVLAAVVPTFTVQRLPDFLECEIIFQIFLV